MSLRLRTSATKLLALSAVFLAPPSYSEYVFGTTDNAALGGSSWGMSSPLFPMASIPGIDINGVFYRYTAVKNPTDTYTVSIQNKAANGSGYIFRETDDWSGGSGGTIQKYIPLQYSPLGDWGSGEINEVGLGRVEDPIVLYSYRVDTDRLQQQPEIPDLPTYDIYDPLNDPYVNAALEPTDLTLIQDDEEPEKDNDEEEDKERLETALAASDNALAMGMSMSQNAMLQAMNVATNMTGYYAKELQGGKYQETVVLTDKNIPDNRRALRSLGQQKLHTDMVDQQYGR